MSDGDSDWRSPRNVSFFSVDDDGPLLVSAEISTAETTKIAVESPAAAFETLADFIGSEYGIQAVEGGVDATIYAQFLYKTFKSLRDRPEMKDKQIFLLQDNCRFHLH